MAHSEKRKQEDDAIHPLNNETFSPDQFFNNHISSLADCYESNGISLKLLFIGQVVSAGEKLCMHTHIQMLCIHTIKCYSHHLLGYNSSQMYEIPSRNVYFQTKAHQIMEHDL